MFDRHLYPEGLAVRRLLLLGLATAVGCGPGKPSDTAAGKPARREVAEVSAADAPFVGVWRSSRESQNIEFSLKSDYSFIFRGQDRDSDTMQVAATGTWKRVDDATVDDATVDDATVDDATVELTTGWSQSCKMREGEALCQMSMSDPPNRVTVGDGDDTLEELKRTTADR